jgi:hypothetical protein
MKSSSTSASEEANDFFGDVARLLIRIECKGRWTGKLTGQLTVHADEEGRAVSWMGVTPFRQVGAVERRKRRGGNSMYKMLSWYMEVPLFVRPPKK